MTEPRSKFHLGQTVKATSFTDCFNQFIPECPNLIVSDIRLVEGVVGPKGQRFINMNSRLTVHIATEVHAQGWRGHIEEVNRLSALYSVAGWPAVDWSL